MPRRLHTLCKALGVGYDEFLYDTKPLDILDTKPMPDIDRVATLGCRVLALMRMLGVSFEDLSNLTKLPSRSLAAGVYVATTPSINWVVSVASALSVPVEFLLSGDTTDVVGLDIEELLSTVRLVYIESYASTSKKKVGLALKSLMRDRFVTAADVSRATGVKGEVIRSCIRLGSIPNEGDLEKLAEYFGVTVADLLDKFGGEVRDESN